MQKQANVAWHKNKKILSLVGGIASVDETLSETYKDVLDEG